MPFNSLAIAGNQSINQSQSWCWMRFQFQAQHLCCAMLVDTQRDYLKAIENDYMKIDELQSIL